MPEGIQSIRSNLPDNGKIECDWCNYINAGKVFHLTEIEDEDEETDAI